MNELMHVAEASAFTGVPVSTLRWYRAMNQGPKSGKLAGRVVYRKSDLEVWIAEAFA